MFKKFETNFAGKKLVVEVGKMATLSNGSCLVRYGETAVLVNVNMSKEPREGIDFLPLSVDYEERLYSVGKIPGGYIKREGKPSTKAILVSRVIDRPLRPLFPKDYRNDTAINALVLAVDPDILPEIPASVGASVALNISDIPFDTLVGTVKVGIVDDKIVLNPDLEQREKSILDLTVSATPTKICMIEAGANEVSDEKMLEAIKVAHQEIKNLCEFIFNIKAEVGKKKAEYKSFAIPQELADFISDIAYDKMKEAVQTKDKNERDERILEKANDEKWIIDGNYNKTLQERLEKADLIIWLDYSTFAQLKGVSKRIFKNFNKDKPDIPGCKERLDFTFVKYVLGYNKTKRPKVLEMIKSIPSDKVLIFKKQKDLNKWLKDFTQNNKILYSIK